jgi:cysteinyl-tRNA synthetase
MDSAPATDIDIDYQEKFHRAINNDLNMPQALAVVQEMLKSDLAPEIKLSTVFDFDRILGLDLNRVAGIQTLPEEVEKLVAARRKARQDKDWALSDQLRDQMQAMGYVVQDKPDGMKVFKP